MGLLRRAIIAGAISILVAWPLASQAFLFWGSTSRPLKLLYLSLPLFPLSYWLQGRDKRRRAGRIAVVAVWAFYLMVAVSSWGQTDGVQLAMHGTAPLRAYYLGVRAPRVLPNFSPVSLPQGYQPGQALVLLGSANGTVVLYDCRAQRLYRVPTSTTLTVFPYGKEVPTLDCHALP